MHGVKDREVEKLLARIFSAVFRYQNHTTKSVEMSLVAGPTALPGPVLSTLCEIPRLSTRWTTVVWMDSFGCTGSAVALLEYHRLASRVLARVSKPLIFTGTCGRLPALWLQIGLYLAPYGYSWLHCSYLIFCAYVRFLL